MKSFTMNSLLYNGCQQSRSRDLPCLLLTVNVSRPKLGPLGYTDVDALVRTGAPPVEEVVFCEKREPPSGDEAMVTRSRFKLLLTPLNLRASKVQDFDCLHLNRMSFNRSGNV